MGRRFKDMRTPEQQWAARQIERPATATGATVRPASNAEWRAMTVRQQAAHLARLDGREDDARKWERSEAEANAPQPKKKRGWLW
ncbi:hypothetical protein [Streptomyces acidiscabies]|uniref:hypothetical protein n=1 Tax=Streptomyces acidiscabies TaxID=42234 RepID=UPI0038F680F6